MTTKAEIKAAGKEAEAWDKRRAWELAWRESVKGQKFRVESVMMSKQVVTGKASTILQSKGFKIKK